MRSSASRTFLALFAALAALAAVAPSALVVAVDTSAAAQPPIAAVKPKILGEHGGQRVDNYYWLKERTDPNVIAYLEAENLYADARLARIKPRIDEIYAEMKPRAVNVDVNPPFLDGGYFYQRRFGEGKEYQVVVRRKDVPGAPEEVVLDVSALAAEHPQFHLNRWAVSPDGAYVAFAADFKGDGSNRIFVRKIATGAVVDDGIEDAIGDFVFAADSKRLFYLWGSQLWRHTIGSNPSTDTLVYEERDDTFALSLRLSKSRRFILLDATGELSTEVRYLPVDTPSRKFRLIQPRRPGVRYYADHLGDKFYIRTNLKAPDFRVVTAPQGAPGAANWKELIPETRGRFISHFELFDRFIAVDEEHDAITSLRVFSLANMAEIPIPHSGEIGVVAAGGLRGVVNRDPSSRTLRYRVVGPLQPETIYDFHVVTGILTPRKHDPAAAWFDPTLYRSERIFATAPDGEEIPVTLVYRSGHSKAGGNPTLIYGYGAYCSSSDASFPKNWFSLIDRGFVYAIAHVRGGCEYGRRWHDQGRKLTKRNTFTDFIAATEALISAGYTDPKNVFAYGASAGGLLMGAIANMRPDLYAGIVAEVPFVDAITSMSDPAIPLTTYEYEEWGNPAIKEQYDYIRSYSPYDNVAAKAYPAMFVTAGFNDAQVLYVEPAKWVARLRATKTDSNELLLKTTMIAGHQGPSGRLGSIEERAEIIAWLLAQVR
jgi:oligopeptidase B